MHMVEWKNLLGVQLEVLLPGVTDQLPLTPG
jgi:hypothetical protein